MSHDQVQDVWRRESPHVLAALLRRHGDLGECEDAVQEAFAAAAEQWPQDGVPDSPRGWLVRVASRRLIDHVRSRQSRERRELEEAEQRAEHAPPADAEQEADDDSLLLVLLCCHPSLSRSSQVALTLRSVAGLSTAQVAAAYLVPESTMAQRLSRARTTLRENGARFDKPSEDELPERVAAVLDVCHLVFTTGHTTDGETLVDVSLADEAIRLTRQLHASLPEHDEVSGLLALMLLTHARSPARVGDELVPLAEQDRSLWRRDMVDEGVAILERVLPQGHVGRYQLQAAIAAVHAEAPTYSDTDWQQIAILYSMLDRVAPSPAVTLNRAVAVAESGGPEAGLALVEPLLEQPAMRRHHRTHAVRAHLLERRGDPGDAAAALAAYREAARLTTSRPEQRYLNRQAARVEASDGQAPRGGHRRPPAE